MLAADKLEAIVKSKSNDPRILAELAGGDPRSFYRGANFNNADLRGVDLRGYNLTAATFEDAWLDRNTRVDDEFLDITGLFRTVLKLPYGKFIKMKVFKRFQVGDPVHDHLGDLVEEALRDLESRIIDWEAFFKNANDGRPLWVPVSRNVIDLIKYNDDITSKQTGLLEIINNSKKLPASGPLHERMFIFSKSLRDDPTQSSYGVEEWLDDEDRSARQTTLQAAILNAPLKKILRLSSAKSITPELFCSELLLTFISVISMKKRGYASWITLP